jgi:hypothetical protein
VTERRSLLERAVARRAEPEPDPQGRRGAGAARAPRSRLQHLSAGVKPLPERVVGDNRFIWLEHAERDASSRRAARARDRRRLAGVDLLSLHRLRRAIVLAGLKTVDHAAPEFDDPVWGESFRTSAAILAEGAVEVVFLDEDQDRIHRRIWAVTGDTPA